MLITESVLKVTDNSGARYAKCLKVFGQKNIASICSIILISVKKYNPKQNIKQKKKKIQKGDIFKALVVRTKKGIVRSDGSKIQFSDNAIVLFNNNMVLLGNRILGPVCRELRNIKQVKILTLAPSVF
jgi:large subunit ribosomal protein L14